MPEYYEGLAFIVCLIFSSFYSGAEAALISIPLDRTKQLIEEGGSKGRALKFMSANPNEILSTILVGNNLVNVFAASLTSRMAVRHFHNDALAISVGLTTILILLFGEIIPKTFARAKAEKLALPIIRILQINYYIAYPIIKIFKWIIVGVLGENSQITGRLITRDDIEFMINKAEKEKSIDSKHIDLLTSIMEFPTLKVKNIMVPRNQVGSISDELSLPEILEVVGEDQYSRYPVCKGGDLDHVIGFLHVKDLAFVTEQQRRNFRVQEYLKEPFFVYEHMKIQAVFEHMNKKKVHLALVKDENGMVVGIVTLEDIVEEILGEIQDEHDDEESVIRKDKASGGLFVSGQVNIRDLNNEYDMQIPLSDNYTTLRGFILEKLGNNFPKQGHIIIWDEYSFELTRVQNFEIHEVKITNVNGDRPLFTRTST